VQWVAPHGQARAVVIDSSVMREFVSSLHFKEAAHGRAEAEEAPLDQACAAETASRFRHVRFFGGLFTAAP